jgi:diguanylate cyclase (GGDEF)-like protein
MSMNLIAASIYWVIVALWLAVLTTVIVHYMRNPSVFGTIRMLLIVVAIDTARNIVENVYFGLFFGSQLGIFSPEVAKVLGNPMLLIMPKVVNIAAGCFVLGLLLMRWLPKAVDERQRSEQTAADLETLASIDGLTGLYNRAQFDNLLRAEWSRYQRYMRPLSVMIIDVDEFKGVNDRYGHDGGDAMLKAVADICLSTKRDSDMAVRLGGDEFVVLLPETDEAAARILAERVRQNVEASPRTSGLQGPCITVSIGIASATMSMSSADAMLKQADNALYAAKRAGRNRVATAPRSFGEVQRVAAE